MDRFLFRASRRAALALLLLASVPHSASFDGFGIGAQIGSPTGLSGSLPLGDRKAVHATLGIRPGGPADLGLTVDYVWFKPEIVPVESGRLSAYIGPGVMVELSRNAFIGVRAAAGFEYRFADAPVQLFVEFGPGLRVLPDARADAHAGLGARYFF